MHGTEPLRIQARFHRLFPESKRQELAERHHTVLASRQPRQLPLPFPPPKQACLSFRGHIDP